jgi:hypothetical protein
MTLEVVESIAGIFSIIYVVISFIVGIKIALRYRELKQRSYLFVGIAWMLIAESWYPSSVSFIVALFNGGQGLTVFPELYFIIGNILVAPSTLCWLIAFTDLIYKNKQKIILLTYGLVGLLFCIVFFSFLFIDSSLIGTLSGPVDVKYSGFVSLFLIFTLLTVIITGIIFGGATMKSDNPEHKWKGRFLIFAFLFFFFGGLLDATMELTLITLLAVRIILISSSILFYLGFIFPEKLKNFLIKSV